MLVPELVASDGSTEFVMWPCCISITLTNKGVLGAGNAQLALWGAPLHPERVSNPETGIFESHIPLRSLNPHCRGRSSHNAVNGGHNATITHKGVERGRSEFTARRGIEGMLGEHNNESRKRNQGGFSVWNHGTRLRPPVRLQEKVARCRDVSDGEVRN